MITLTFEACKALCDKLTEMGVKLPETYLSWYEHDGQNGKEWSVYRSGLPGSQLPYPAPTFSELITDWLPLLTEDPFYQGEVCFGVLGEAGMPAVSTRVIELVKELK